jgi:hypothetical protein
MKSLTRLVFAAAVLAASIALLPACDTIEDTANLDVENPNEPTPAVLTTEAGVQRLASGLYKSFDLDLPKNFVWNVQVYHEAMGDAIVLPWGNWQFRWVAQVTKIDFEGDGTFDFTPPDGGPQPGEIARINDRSFDSDAAVIQEWGSMYFLNNQANLLLQTLDENEIAFRGDAAAKTNGYRAWAHFWKGYAYARIGSMYEQGLILNEYGATQGDFRSQSEIIAESNAQFDAALQSISGIDAIAADVVPSLLTDAEVSVPTAASMTQVINTLKARNLLVNKRRSAMTQSDWQEISTLTGNGLTSNEGTLILRGDNFVTYPSEVWFIWQAASNRYPWHRVSERILDDTQPGDPRVDDCFEQSLNDDDEPISWPTLGRGVQYNSSWTVDACYATQTSTEPEIKWYFTSVEENMLMQAEAALALGSPGDAAALVDQVRAMQGAGSISPVDPNGDVFEQIRSERRIGLFLRGLAFYDARRLGVIDPYEDGGGREGVTVIANDGTFYDNATIDYNFLPYWPVPDEELTFNPAQSGDGQPGNPE